MVTLATLDTAKHTGVGSTTRNVPNPGKRHSRVGYPLAHGEHEPYGYTKYGSWHSTGKDTISTKLHEREAFTGHSLWSRWEYASVPEPFTPMEVYRIYSYNLCVAEYWPNLDELVLLENAGSHGHTTARHMSTIHMSLTRHVRKVTVV